MERKDLGEVWNTCILKYNKKGELLESIEINDGDDHNFGFFDIDKDGNLYIPDRNILWKRNKKGQWEIMSNDFYYLGGVVVSSDGFLYITDYGDSALYRVKMK